MTLEPNTKLQLVEKHSRAIRWMHWINFPVLMVMIWSGLLIYWGDSTPPYQNPHQVYRIGVGSWTLVRLFPDWFWKLLNAPYQLTTGLGWHFLFMWVFAINGIAYAVYLGVSGEWRVLWPQRRNFVDAMWVTLYDLHVPAARRRGMPAQGKYNGAQRISYTAIVLMGAGSLVTGLSIYKPTQAHWLTSLVGGYEMARWLHFWLTMGFCGFFLVHVGQVVLAGWNNFRSMVSGYEIQETGGTGIALTDNGGMTCRVCGGPTKHYASKNGYEILKCTVCGFGQVPLVQEDLNRLYEEAYWNGDATEGWSQSEDSPIPPSYVYWLEQQLKLLPKAAGTLRVLEIGPGLGAMVANYLRDRHPEIAYEAIEISDFAAKSLGQRGFMIHVGGITTHRIIDACRGRFDLVVGTEVIEHDPDPHAFAAAVRAVLKPGGWCAFTTGNIDGLISRWKKADWYYLDPPLHVSYYTPKAFKKLFAPEGFDEISSRRYGFNYIRLKMEKHIPGLLWFSHVLGLATGMCLRARRSQL